MAHHKSAQKRIRQTVKRTAVNRARVSRIRTLIKNVELAIAEGDASNAKSALQAAQPEIHRGVARGVMHKKTAARKISRLSHRIKAIA